MTLLAVWRQEHTIHVAADSRISFRGQPTVIDMGAKIVPVEVRILGPTPSGGNEPEWVHSRRVGIAVAGSHTTAAILQASLDAFMGSVSSVYEPIDMASMAGIVEEVFQYILREVCAALFEGGMGEVVLVGHCDTTGRPRAFLFEIALQPNRLSVHTTEMLTTTTREYRGSGRPAALALGGLHPFEVLKQVALDPTVPSVGGPIQYGRVTGTDFQICMVQDYEADDEARTITVGFYLHGLPVHGGEIIHLPHGYVRTGTALLPYRTRIEALISEGYDLRLA